MFDNTRMRGRQGPQAHHLRSRIATRNIVLCNPDYPEELLFILHLLL